MPCVFTASLGVNHIRLLINTIAAVGDEYVRTKKANLLVPLLNRLTSQEQQSLILVVATAIILGGHLEHTVRTLHAVCGPRLRCVRVACGPRVGGFLFAAMCSCARLASV